MVADGAWGTTPHTTKAAAAAHVRLSCPVRVRFGGDKTEGYLWIVGLGKEGFGEITAFNSIGVLF